MYTIERRYEKQFEVYYIKFDESDRWNARNLADRRVLSKEKLNALSVQFSNNKITFKITFMPGQNYERICNQIQGMLNLSSMMGSNYDGMDANTAGMFNQLFGGAFKK